MKLYRLFTERKDNLYDIHKVVSQHYGAATVYESLGVWEGTQEQSYVVEILAPQRDYQLVLKLASTLKFLGQQQNVLVQTLDVESELV